MDINKKLERDFTPALIKALAANLHISIEAYQRICSENKEFFGLQNSKTVLGYLRTYAVQRQFYIGGFHPDAFYSARLRKTNNFKYETLFLETENFILNIGRTEKRGKLLSVANYKRELARANVNDDPQIQLEFSDTDASCLKSVKNYAILAYGYNENVGITHFDVLVPSGTYTGIIAPIKSLYIPKKEIVFDFEQDIEPDIISLKENLEKTFGRGEKFYDYGEKVDSI